MLKLSNLGLAVCTALKFFSRVVKGSKLKVRKFWELILKFVKITGEELVKVVFLHLNLNRVRQK